MELLFTIPSFIEFTHAEFLNENQMSSLYFTIPSFIESILICIATDNHFYRISKLCSLSLCIGTSKLRALLLIINSPSFNNFVATDNQFSRI